MVRRLLWQLAIGGVLGLSLTFCVTAPQKGRTTRVEIQGHRGARAVRPENTLPAFEYALSLPVDVLELDLGVTRDNVLVIYHDQHINPVICRFKDGRPAVKKPLHSLTLRQIKQYDCGSQVNPRFPRQQLVPGTEIATLDELFAAIKASPLPAAAHVRFNIETKSNPAQPHLQPSPAKFAQLLYTILQKHGMVERTVVQSFDHRTLIEIKKLNPSIKTAALFEERPAGDFVQAVRDAQAEIVSPNYEWLTVEDVRIFHQAGLQVIPWTINDADGWRRLLQFGVDGIITDDPAALLKFLKNEAN